MENFESYENMVFEQQQELVQKHEDIVGLLRGCEGILKNDVGNIFETDIFNNICLIVYSFCLIKKDEKLYDEICIYLNNFNNYLIMLNN